MTHLPQEKYCIPKQYLYSPVISPKQLTSLPPVFNLQLAPVCHCCVSQAEHRAVRWVRQSMTCTCRQQYLHRVWNSHFTTQPDRTQPKQTIEKLKMQLTLLVLGSFHSQTDGLWSDALWREMREWESIPAGLNTDRGTWDRQAITKLSHLGALTVMSWRLTWIKVEVQTHKQSIPTPLKVSYSVHLVSWERPSGNRLLSSPCFCQPSPPLLSVITIQLCQ